jgi:ribosomal protein S18 acetylase RimI-like enzyme
MALNVVRVAVAKDIDSLQRLEETAFRGDRLTRRSFRRWLRHSLCVFLVCERAGKIAGYILIGFRRGSRRARMYSLAVDPAWRRRGIALLLIEKAEQATWDAGALSMRLEVAANNAAAVQLYRKLGYMQFGVYRDYYEDHSDALRMEKCINEADRRSALPWSS